MTDEIQIDLGRAWCSFHALPWKATWPDANALVAMMEIFNAFVADPDVQRRAGYVEGQTTADTSMITRLIKDEQPLCCWLAKRDPDALVAAYAKVDVSPPSLQG